MVYRVGFEGHFALSRRLSAWETRLLRQVCDEVHEDRVSTSYSSNAVSLAAHLFWPSVRTSQIVKPWQPRKEHTSKPLEAASYPGRYCHWVLNSAGTALEWDGEGGFCNHVAWLDYLVQVFFNSWCVSLKGVVEWTGEECMDSGILSVFGNCISVALFPSSYRVALPDPVGELADAEEQEPWPFFLDAERFGCNVRERLLSMLLAARLGDGSRLHDLGQDTLLQLLEWERNDRNKWEAARGELRTFLTAVFMLAEGCADEMLQGMNRLLLQCLPTSLTNLLLPSGDCKDVLPSPWLIRDPNPPSQPHPSPATYLTITRGGFLFTGSLSDTDRNQLSIVASSWHIDGQAPGYPYPTFAPTVMMVKQRHNIADPPTPQQLALHTAPPLARNYYPGSRCNWRIAASGRLEWDSMQAGREFVAWLAYLIANFFDPWNIMLSGTMEWNGEELWDSGLLIVNNNYITVSIFPLNTRLPCGWLAKKVIPYIPEQHHVKHAIKERLMLMLLAGKPEPPPLSSASDDVSLRRSTPATATLAIHAEPPGPVRKMAQQLLQGDLGLASNDLYDIQHALVQVCKGSAGAVDVIAAIVGMSPALTLYLLDNTLLASK